MTGSPARRPARPYGRWPQPGSGWRSGGPIRPRRPVSGARHAATVAAAATANAAAATPRLMPPWSHRRSCAPWILVGHSASFASYGVGHAARTCRRRTRRTCLGRDRPRAPRLHRDPEREHDVRPASGASTATCSAPSTSSATGARRATSAARRSRSHELAGPHAGHRRRGAGDRRRRAHAAHADTVLLYGHLDKQPEMHGWREGLGPWTPVLDGDRLYGRGGADDGYSAFASLDRDRGGPRRRTDRTPAASC